MDAECAAIQVLKESFPNSLVGLEVMYGQLSPNLRRDVLFLSHNFLALCGSKNIAKIFKIVKRRTFKLTIYTRKYLKMQELQQKLPLNNLGTPRLTHRPLIINFLIG